MSDDDAMPPPADLDKLDDIKIASSRDTSKHSDASFDSCLSPPPLTAIYSSNTSEENELSIVSSTALSSSTSEGD